MNNQSIEQKLIEAIRWGNRIEVILAIKGGASVHTKDGHGNEVVLLAATLNHWLVVDDLLHLKAHVEAQTISGGNRLVHYAAAHGEWGALCSLFRFKASMNVVNRFGDTPLDVAIRNNHQRVIEFLRQNGARAKAEFHHVRDVAMNVARDYTAKHFGEEYACLCEHGLSHHSNEVGHCQTVIRKSNGDEELCNCDSFADVWGREVPSRQHAYRDTFGY